MQKGPFSPLVSIFYTVVLFISLSLEICQPVCWMVGEGGLCKKQSSSSWVARSRRSDTFSPSAESFFIDRLFHQFDICPIFPCHMFDVTELQSFGEARPFSCVTAVLLILHKCSFHPEMVGHLTHTCGNPRVCLNQRQPIHFSFITSGLLHVEKMELTWHNTHCTLIPVSKCNIREATPAACLQSLDQSFI